tara:strand:+ start:683 stop:985 length:303 start_codon:yes stop_codon:yes gene_type:complete
MWKPRRFEKKYHRITHDNKHHYSHDETQQQQQQEQQQQQHRQRINQERKIDYRYSCYEKVSEFSFLISLSLSLSSLSLKFQKHLKKTQQPHTQRHRKSCQ